MGLSSFKFVQWAPKDASFPPQSAFWALLAVQGHSWSSKVDDFGTNRKRVCDFLVINSNFGPILHRFRDTATYWLKIAYFSYPSLIWRPSCVPVFPLEFRAEVKQEETRVMGLSYSEDRMIVAGVVLKTQCQRLTDGQTDGRTDRRTDLRQLIQRLAYQAMLTRCKNRQFTDGVCVASTAATTFMDVTLADWFACMVVIVMHGCHYNNSSCVADRVGL